MAATPLALCAKLWDLNTGAIALVDVQRADLTTHVISTVTNVPAVATNEMIVVWALGKRRSAAGSVKLGVTFGNAFANAVIAAVGGASYTADPLPYYLLLWNNGGAGNPRSICWLKGVTVNPGGPNRGITIETLDLFEGMSFSGIDHMTVNGAPLADVLDAAAGEVRISTTPDASGGTTSSTGFFPVGVRGFDKNVALAPSMRDPGTAQGAANLALATFTFMASATPSTFAATPINSDNWAVSVAEALLAVMQAAGGKWDRADVGIPLGARAAFHVDIANRVVHCGEVGTVPVLELVAELPEGAYELDETAQAWFDLSQLPISPGNEAARAQYERTGGPSNHGLPDGWTNTGLEILFPDAGANDAWLHLQIVSGVTGNDGGGVYCNLHDGLLRPISQAFDATCMAYDGTSKAVVVGTPYGPLMYTPTTTTITDLPTTLPTWAPPGGFPLSVPIKALCIPAEGIVWALADEGNGSVSVFQYPAISGDDNTDLGFPGWSRIHQGTVLFMAGGIGNLYYVDSNDPTALLLAVPGAAAAPVDMSPAAGAGIIGLDYLPGLAQIAIRTTGGAASLWYLNLGDTTITTLNPGGADPTAGGLADRYGYLQVYRIQQPGAVSLNGSPVSLLASTDQGGYFSDGGAPFWKPMSAQSGAGDRSVQFIAASPTQAVLGRDFERVYLGTPEKLLVSNTGGINSFDLLAAALDEGPVWTECAQRCPLGLPWPDNTIGALIPDGSDLMLAGLNGAVGATGLFIPLDDLFDAPANNVWVRRLSGRNDFTWREVIVDSSAPYFGIDTQPMSAITADDSTPARVASERLKLAGWRATAVGQANPLTLPLTGLSYRTQEAALATLFTSNLVDLTANLQQIGPDGTITQVVAWDHLGVYVLEYDEFKDGSVMKVNLTVGTKMTLLDSPDQLLTEIVAGTSYEVGRINRYK